MPQMKAAYSGDEEALLVVPFPKKLWKIVNECECGAIGWSEDGKKVEVDYVRFEEYYFNDRLDVFTTKNVDTFVRQLNNYGFRKVHNPYISRRSFKHVFQHDYFVRDRPDLLRCVRRRIRSKKHHEDGGPGSAAKSLQPPGMDGINEVCGKGTMKGDEVIDEASSTGSDAGKVMKEGDNCEDIASTSGTQSSKAADGSKLPPDSSRNPNQQCYCGKERNMNIVELQCLACLKWFHDTCLSLPLGKCVPFMTNYTFSCKRCNPAGIENFSKKQANFSQMCVAALANLIQKSRTEGTNRTLFSKDKEIIPFIEKNWENMTTVPRRVKQTWHTTVYKTMTKDMDVFTCEEKTESGEVTDNHPCFGLIITDLKKIGPNYENLVRGGQGRGGDSQFSSGSSASKGRGTKRKYPGENQTATSGKKNKSDLVMPKLPPNGYPLDHPYNKDGYRYILAEPDPHAPFRQEFDESTDCAGKPIPAWLYRKLQPSAVLLAMHDRAPQLKLTEDRLNVTGEKGYCMVRATHGVEEGKWYFEATIEEMPENSATRMGWSQELANLQAPLGYDRFGYSWRSRKGTRFHESRGYHYHDGGYGAGDTIGCLIELPKSKEKEGKLSLPDAYKDRRLVKVKSYLYFEEKDELQAAIKNLKPLPGSKITFYKNGECVGTAWNDINEGMYYPSISLYKGCTVRLNFGPNFKHKPKDENCLGMYESVDRVIVQQTMSDILYLVENESQMRLDAIYF